MERIKQILVLIFLTVITFSSYASSDREIDAYGTASLKLRTNNTDRFTIDTSGNYFFAGLLEDSIPYIGASGQILTALGFTFDGTDFLFPQTQSSFLVGDASGVKTETTDLTYDLVGKIFLLDNEGELRLGDAADAEYIGIKVPTALSGSTTFTLPDGDGLADQVIVTNGSGSLSWADQSGGGGGDVSNLLTDGGFDEEATSGSAGLTCTVGTCTQETTDQFIGSGTLKISLAAEIADVIKCYDNSNGQWNNQTIEINAFIKSSDSSVELCYWDGSVEKSCQEYNGSVSGFNDKWTHIKVVQAVGTESDICWKIKSDSITDDIFVDASSISSLKVDGTTKVETQYSRYGGLVNEGSTRNRIAYFPDLIETLGNVSDLYSVTNDSTNGIEIEVLKDNTSIDISPALNDAGSSLSFAVTLNLSGGDFTTGITGLDQTKVISSGAGVSGTANGYSAAVDKIYNAGDKLYVHLASAVVTPSLRNTLSINAVRHVQKSIISNLSSESTFTNWTPYTPTTQGIGAAAINAARYQRVGSNMLVYVDVTTGVTVASEFQISLPDSLEVKAGITTQALGFLNYNNNNEIHYPILATGGDNFLNIGRRYTSGATAFTPQNGSVLGNSTRISFFVTVPIEGWDAKPQIVADITDHVQSPNSGGKVSLCSFTYNTASNAVSNTIGGCDPTFASSVGTGDDTLNWSAGYWESEPNCSMGEKTTNPVKCNYILTGTTSVRFVCFNTTSGAATDVAPTLICHGIRN